MGLVVREHRQPAKHPAEAPLEQRRARYAHQSPQLRAVPPRRRPRRRRHHRGIGADAIGSRILPVALSHRDPRSARLQITDTVGIGISRPGRRKTSGSSRGHWIRIIPDSKIGTLSKLFRISLTLILVSRIASHFFPYAQGGCEKSPPSTQRVWPVTNAAASLARNTTASATSFGTPTRPRGVTRPHVSA